MITSNGNGKFKLEVIENDAEDGEEQINLEHFDYLTEIGAYLFGTNFHRDSDLRISVTDPEYNDVTMEAMTLALYLEKAARRIAEAGKSVESGRRLEEELIENGIIY